MSAAPVDMPSGPCVSDEFHEAFASGGCSHVVCACGRENGAPDADFSVIVLDLGVLVADGCECGKGPRHEQWIWDHRSQIAAYLNARGKRELESAMRCAEASAAALGSLRNIDDKGGAA